MRQLSLIVFLLGLVFAASLSKVQANPKQMNLAAFSDVESPAIVKVNSGYGCGWDYPCPPRPYYGKRYYQYRYGHQAPQVNIRNNYGTVNVYLGGRRYLYRKRYYPRYRYGCDGYRCEKPYWRRSSYVREDWDRGYRRYCGGYPCNSNCGTWCWYKRFKQGYCGHGCDVYRQKVRFEVEERTVRVPRPVYIDPVPVKPSYVEDKPLGPIYANEPEIVNDENFERRRYYGPPYPP